MSVAGYALALVRLERLVCPWADADSRSELGSSTQQRLTFLSIRL